MKAILMAAGVGSRISRNINCPKCTLKVGNEPLIRRTVSMLISNGIDVAVVLGYESAYIKEVLKDLPVTFFVNPFFRITNSIASLWFAREFIDDDLILANADVFWEQDILDCILDDEHPITMLADESRVDNGDYFFNVSNGYLTDFGKNLTREQRTSEYVGMARISKEMIGEFRNHLEEMIGNEQFDVWWENVLYHYLRTMPVYVKDVSEFFWAEIDYISDYQRIMRYLETHDLKVKLSN